MFGSSFFDLKSLDFSVRNESNNRGTMDEYCSKQIKICIDEKLKLHIKIFIYNKLEEINYFQKRNIFNRGNSKNKIEIVLLKKRFIYDCIRYKIINGKKDKKRNEKLNKYILMNNLDYSHKNFPFITDYHKYYVYSSTLLKKGRFASVSLERAIIIYNNKALTTETADTKTVYIQKEEIIYKCEISKCEISVVENYNKDKFLQAELFLNDKPKLKGKISKYKIKDQIGYDFHDINNIFKEILNLKINNFQLINNKLSIDITILFENRKIEIDLVAKE